MSLKDHPHAPLVKGLGGPAAVARWLTKHYGEAVSRQSITMWLRGDREIAHKHRPAIIRMAREKRKTRLIPSGFDKP